MNRLTALVLVVSATACATVIACTTETTNTSTPNPDGGGGSSGSSGNNGGDGGDGTGGSAKIGTITMSQTVTDIPALPDPIITTMVMASFIETTGTTGGTTTSEAKCTTSTEGSCSIIECDMTGVTQQEAGTPAGDGGTAKKSPHAGEITVKAVSEVKLTPDEANGTYAAKTGQARLWNDGDDINVKAVGADVPAFEKSIKGLGPITLTAPEWPAAPASITIVRANDLTLNWTGGTVGNISVSAITSLDKKTATMTCTFKADAGTGTISKAALGKMLATNGVFSVSSSNTEVVTAGDWKVSISVPTQITTEDGTSPLPTATFE